MIENLRRSPFSSVGSELKWRRLVVIVNLESNLQFVLT